MGRWLGLRWVRSCLAAGAVGSATVLLSACQGLVDLPTTVTDVSVIGITAPTPPGPCTGLCGMVEFTVGGPPTRPFACYVQVTRAGTTVGATLTSGSPPAGNDAPVQEAATLRLTPANPGPDLAATVTCASSGATSG